MLGIKICHGSRETRRRKVMKLIYRFLHYSSLALNCVDLRSHAEDRVVNLVPSNSHAEYQLGSSV